MKVLFIGTISPEGKDNGKKIVLSGITDYFKSIDCDFYYVVPERESYEAAYAKYSAPSLLKIFINVLIGSVLFRSRSIQESFFFSRRTAKDLLSIVEEISPDIIVYDTIRVAQYIKSLKNFPARHIIYLDDLFSLRYERIIKSKALGLNLLGNFEKNLPKTIVKLFGLLGGAKNIILRFEAFLVRRSELRLTSLADRSLLISSDEVNFLREIQPDAAEIMSIPPRLLARGGLLRSWAGDPVFIFLGSLNLPHNFNALERLITMIMPGVKSIAPGVKLTVIGGGDSSELMRMATAHAVDVSFTGYVSSLDEYLASASALVAPLNFGSGVKLKIIEALQHGLPIITSEIGVEGIEFSSDIHGKICASDDDFVNAMIALLEPDVNFNVSAACKELYRDVYSIDAVDKCYDSIFK